MRQLLEEKKYISDRWVDSVLVKLPKIKNEQNLPIICLSGERLGLWASNSYMLCMVTALLIFELKPCQGEIAIGYLLKHGSELENGTYCFGMHPIKDDNDNDCIFIIRVENKKASLSLHNIQKPHGEDVKWIFVLPPEKVVEEE